MWFCGLPFLRALLPELRVIVRVALLAARVLLLRLASRFGLCALHRALHLHPIGHVLYMLNEVGVRGNLGLRLLRLEVVGIHPVL